MSIILISTGNLVLKSVILQNGVRLMCSTYISIFMIVDKCTRPEDNRGCRRHVTLPLHDTSISILVFVYSYAVLFLFLF